MMTLADFLSEWHDDSPWLTVHTSGSTGDPKPLRVEKERMRQSALMTLSFLGVEKGETALLCMPLDYIAGKMMVVRSVVGQLKLISIPPTGHPMADPTVRDEPIGFAAMVPLQVYNSLQVPEERERLKNVSHLIIGGGAVDPDLENRLRGFPNAIWSTYGMTETLSHIAMRRINGLQASSWYQPLPGVVISQDDEGCLVIHAPKVCAQELKTNDIVELHADGQHFKILGRKDNVICCGGIKIQAEQVEEILRPYLAAPFYIGKMKDAKFGEIPVLVSESLDKKTLEDIISHVLPKYWCPRKIVTVKKLPVTETGKPRRSVIPLNDG